MEKVRISKLMAERGLCSRREADSYIERGWVKVDGVVVTLGERALPTQEITLERSAAVQQTSRVTILIHKPMGYVSGQAEDGYTPAVALIGPQSRALSDRSAQRIERSQLRGLAVAGRLDIDSTGLLVMTQDGRVARQLMSSMLAELTLRFAFLISRVSRLPSRQSTSRCTSRLRRCSNESSEVAMAVAGSLSAASMPSRRRLRSCSMVWLSIIWIL